MKAKNSEHYLYNRFSLLVRGHFPKHSPPIVTSALPKRLFSVKAMPAPARGHVYVYMLKQKATRVCRTKGQQFRRTRRPTSVFWIITHAQHCHYIALHILGRKENTVESRGKFQVRISGGIRTCAPSRPQGKESKMKLGEKLSWRSKADALTVRRIKTDTVSYTYV